MNPAPSMNPAEAEHYEVLQLGLPNDRENVKLEMSQNRNGSRWKSLPPLSSMKVQDHLPIQMVIDNVKKKYKFKREACCGDIKMWRYDHCHRTCMLFIRKVQKSPEIHLEVRPCGEGSKVTAVAESGRSILEIIVYRDIRCTDVRNAIKRRCVETGLCTHQTSITIYLDNVLLDPNTMLRKDPAAYPRRRLPRIMGAKDGSLTDGYICQRCKRPYTPTSPQSRTGDITPQSRIVATDAAIDGMRTTDPRRPTDSRRNHRTEYPWRPTAKPQTLGDRRCNRDAADDGDDPSAKKQKTAGSGPKVRPSQAPELEELLEEEVKSERFGDMVIVPSRAPSLDDDYWD